MFETSDQNHDDCFVDVILNSVNFSDISIGLVGKSLKTLMNTLMVEETSD
jgi:hypothetical protein